MRCGELGRIPLTGLISGEQVKLIMLEVSLCSNSNSGRIIDQKPERQRMVLEPRFWRTQLSTPDPQGSQPLCNLLDERPVVMSKVGEFLRICPDK
jgi:hypothetical protein